MPYIMKQGCKALTEHIEEGRQSIRDMESDIAQNTPQLFYIYADASESEQELLLVMYLVLSGSVFFLTYIRSII